MAGVSRSVALVLAFLIKKKGMSFDQAYSMVKGRRRIIHPNDGFVRQLKTYESQCNKKGTTDFANKTMSYSRIEIKSSLYDSPLKKYESNVYQSPLKKYY